MSEFMTDRRIDRGFLKAVDYMTDWRSRFGFPKGQPMPQGLPANMSDAIKSGAINKLQPVGEAVGGLAISPVGFSKALGIGLRKLGSKYRNVANARGLSDFSKFAPRKALDPLNKLNIVKEIPTKYPGSHIKGTTTRRGGSTKSDVALTPRADEMTGQHEVSSHVYNQAFRQENSKAGKLTNILETISEGQEKHLAKMINSGKIKKGSKEAYVLSRGKLNEIHARNLSNELTVEQTIAKMKNKKAFMAGKSRMSDAQFDALHGREVKRILNAYESKHPRQYAAGKLEAEKNWKAERKIDEITKLLNQDTTQGSIKAVHKVFDKRFPDKIGGWDEATKLGKEFTLKDLNRIRLKERKSAETLFTRKKNQTTADYVSDMNKSQIHQTRSQSAREAMESVYVKTLGQTYNANSKFKPAKFEIWLTNQLKK